MLFYYYIFITYKRAILKVVTIKLLLFLYRNEHTIIDFMYKPQIPNENAVVYTPTSKFSTQ